MKTHFVFRVHEKSISCQTVIKNFIVYLTEASDGKVSTEMNFFMELHQFFSHNFPPQQISFIKYQFSFLQNHRNEFVSSNIINAVVA